MGSTLGVLSCFVYHTRFRRYHTTRQAFPNNMQALSTYYRMDIVPPIAVHVNGLNVKILCFSLIAVFCVYRVHTLDS